MPANGTDQRTSPLSVDSLRVVVDHAGFLVCSRCDKDLSFGQVALMTRLAPGGPFDTWCHRCTLQLVQWAHQGALVDMDVCDALEKDDSP